MIFKPSVHAQYHMLTESLLLVVTVRVGRRLVECGTLFSYLRVSVGRIYDHVGLERAGILGIIWKMVNVSICCQLVPTFLRWSAIITTLLGLVFKQLRSPTKSSSALTQSHRKHILTRTPGTIGNNNSSNNFLGLSGIL